MKLSQVKEYVTGVLKQWFTNKPILDKFNETETGELLYGTKAISSNPVLKYQKYLNTELDYAHFMLPAQTMSEGNFYNITKDSSNGIEYTTNSFYLKKGKTYSITASTVLNISIKTNSASQYRLYNKTTNTNIGPLGISISVSWDNTRWNNCDINYIYSPAEDCEIALQEITGYNPSIIDGYITIQEINHRIIIDPVEYVNTEQGLEDTPVGHIISHMGIKAPSHYLICDGTEYNIADYPHLAQHFIDNFGRVNRFGGDGIDTFCVPNELSQVAVINELTTEDLWTADSKYIFEEAGAFSVVGGRTYYKKNAGKAIVAVARTTDGHTYPWLISTNQEYVTHYCSYNTSHISNDATTIEYLGLTWYCVRALYGFNESHTPSGFAVMVQCSTYSTNYAQVALEILKAASVTDTQPDAIPCIKYEPTYYISAHSPLVGRSETILFEGNYSDSHQSGVLTSGIEISDSIENYDELYFEACSPHAGYNIIMTRYTKPEVFLPYGAPSFVISEYNNSNNYANINIGFINSTTLAIGYKASKSWSNPHISKIIGVKYQEAQLKNNTNEDINSAILEAVAEINEEV